jgi:3-oxoacyl-[acyl-carrier-protein] synthase II
MPESAVAAAARRVVVTGMGAVTPLAPDLPAGWRALAEGRSGVRAIRSFDASALPSRIAGESLDADPARVLDRKEIKRTDRCTQLALLATQEALADAGLPEHLEGHLAEETGAIIGTGFGGALTIAEQIATFVERGPDRVSPFFIATAIANIPAGQVGITFGSLGPNLATVSACASGGHAIGEAAEMIRRGDAEVMLAGGTEAAVHPVYMAGFAAMRALSTRNDEPEAASRPFDKGRDGFVIAEGSATLVLEELDHAARRGARILAELLGYGASADAYRLTLPPPGGTGALRASRRALAKAGVTAAEVDHVSAHATSTPDGDSTELEALRSLLGDHAPEVSISAIKSAIGHTLGAAGAIAAAMAICALRDGCSPPTLNLTDPDPAGEGLDLTALAARRRPMNVALVNAFGFGGQNSALIFRRWAGA